LTPWGGSCLKRLKSRIRRCRHSARPVRVGKKHQLATRHAPLA
jgi:hypothetical protein